jgi:hypothetical protein
MSKTMVSADQCQIGEEELAGVTLIAAHSDAGDVCQIDPRKSQ